MSRKPYGKNKRQDLSLVNLNDSQCVRINRGEKSVAYFCRNSPVRVDRRLILKLKEIAKNIQDRGLRLCLHSDCNAPMQEMIILARKDRYYRPHKHLTKGEVFHLIEGAIGVFSFSDKGDIIDACILDRNNSFMYKVKMDMYHTVMPISELAILHESRPGPFTGESDSVYPLWAPDGSNQKESVKYTAYLKRALRKR